MTRLPNDSLAGIMNGTGLAGDTNGTATDTSPAEAGWLTVLPAELKATLVSLIGLGLVLGNVFVVVVILRSAALRNYTGYLTVSLACADMLPGLLVIPFSVRPAWTGHWTYGQTLCMVTTYFSSVCALASTLSLVGLAVNRYILIVHAMKYQSIMGPKLCTAMITAAWVLPAVSFAVSIFGDGRFRYLPNAMLCALDFGGVVPLGFAIAFLASVVLVVGVLHCKVYAVALRHLKNIYHYNPKATEDKLQGAKTTAAITFAFCLTWVPYCALAVWQHMLEYPTHPDVEFALLWLYGCNGILNVFIYSGLNRAFREEAKKVIVAVRTCALTALPAGRVDVRTPPVQARAGSGDRRLVAWENIDKTSAPGLEEIPIAASREMGRTLTNTTEHTEETVC
ncbi:PREDICTED: trace amine-associated receptor 9-like [Branchiostoma belcheri]|uniref:Trace amine-associated receptor 9-like n=1 Tax=Branchiostoma belcheri TaxID=7741 RepID=A0A6P4YGG5_BRABE|nr:PREDICTED: trace amine-associated receptor 9-like [Branchiostoma belcheri]